MSRGRCWRNIDYEALNEQLRSVDWMPLFRSYNPEEQTGFFLHQMSQLLDQHAPVRRIKIRNPRAPPITDATKALMSERRAAKRDGDESRYSELNRSVRAAVLRDNRLDISRRIHEAGRSRLYQCLRPIIAAKKTSSSLPDTDPDTLNRFFAGIGVRTAAEVAESRRANPMADLPIILPRVAACQFQVQPVTHSAPLCSERNEQQQGMRYRWTLNAMSEAVFSRR